MANAHEYDPLGMNKPHLQILWLALLLAGGCRSPQPAPATVWLLPGHRLPELTAAALAGERLLANDELLPGQIAIDGDLGDWTGLPGLPATFQQVLDAVPPLRLLSARERGDLAQLRVAHDAEALYLAIRVWDRSLAAETLAIALDFGPLDLPPTPQDERPAAGRHDLRLELQPGREPLCRWEDCTHRLRDPQSLRVAARSYANGYACELRLPLAALLPNAPPERLAQPFGLNLRIHDQDRRDGQLLSTQDYAWTPAGYGCADPRWHPAPGDDWRRAGGPDLIAAPQAQFHLLSLARHAQANATLEWRFSPAPGAASGPPPALPELSSLGNTAVSLYPETGMVLRSFTVKIDRLLPGRYEFRLGCDRLPPAILYYEAAGVAGDLYLRRLPDPGPWHNR